MGEVYRARDTRLKRDVALKILPEAFSTDPDRVARFQREAEVLATLNHPKIAAVYGLEESGGITAIVLELVEGETLAGRLTRLQGHPLPLDEALLIARQISEALEAAHEKGIVHRDLKPANVKITPDGHVKVLDFGLAKILETERSASSLTMSPTLSVHATNAGVILGTAAYMSPEQARGRPTDRRTDIWSFGCVLFEMLTGRQAFESGETVSDAIAAILKEDPDWRALPPSTPEYLRRLVRRCLQKDVQKRLPHIGAARLELDEGPTEAPATTHAPAASRQTGARLVGLAWSAAVLFFLTTVIVGLIAYFRAAPSEGQIARFEFSPPAGWRVDLTLSGVGGSSRPLAVSPDGRRIAFVGRNADGKSEVWLRAVDTVAPQPVVGTDGAVAPFWSPDSRFLGFFADGMLKKVNISGGSPQTLCAASSNRGGTWSRSGIIVFTSAGGPLQKVSESGGVPTAATTLAPNERDHRSPSFLSDSRHFVYYANPTGKIYVGSVDATDRTSLFDSVDAQNVVESKGHLLFLRGTTLFAQPFDVGRLALHGEAVPIADQVLVHTTPPVAILAASASGVLAYQVGSGTVGAELVWVDETGKTLSTIESKTAYGDVELSPDGKRAAVSIPDQQNRYRNVWLFDLVRGLRSRFTFNDEQASTWSPDGRRLIFNSRRNGRQWDLYEKDVDSGANDRLVFSDDSSKTPESWSPDGHWLLYSATNSTLSETASSSPRTNVDLFLLSLDGDRKPQPYMQTPFNESLGRFSPDGHWVAYRSDESGRREIYVAAFPGPGRKTQVSGSSGDWPRWRRDGKELFFLSPEGKLMAAAVSSRGDDFQVGALRPLFDVRAMPSRSYDVARDGRFFVNALEQPTGTLPVTVVTNWAESRQ
jgi:Tol biopolymer transport system component